MAGERKLHTWRIQRRLLATVTVEAADEAEALARADALGYEDWDDLQVEREWTEDLDWYLRDVEEDERDFLAEAEAIIEGRTMLLPERRHLEALRDRFREERRKEVST